jgi:hypothetical protein
VQTLKPVAIYVPSPGFAKAGSVRHSKVPTSFDKVDVTNIEDYRQRTENNRMIDKVTVYREVLEILQYINMR